MERPPCEPLERADSSDALSLPEPWEGPVLRRVDFADNLPVRLVTTSLRRLWLVEPPGIDERVRDKTSWLAQQWKYAFEACGNYITGAAPARAWDDALWCRRTRHKLLTAPESPEARNAHVPLLEEWRGHIKYTYKHVFWDMQQALRLEASHISKFEPNDPHSVMLWEITGSSLQSGLRLDFAPDRDTFLYPVWLGHKVSATIAVGDQRHTWVADGNTWTFGVWLRHDTNSSISFDFGDEKVPGDETLVAVMAQGRCQPRQTARPWVIKEREATDQDRPEYSTEAVHLARAVWLYAGDVTEDCDFDGVYARVDVAEPVERPSSSRLLATVDDAERLYEALPNETSIRLLEVQPGAGRAALRTRLVLVDLKDHPNYEALSYTWGDPNDRVELTCGSSLVSIPANLQDALCQLRYPDRSRFVWADAVCINQADLEERGQQVSIMRDIFQGASRVPVWLGLDPLQQATTAFKAVCDIVRSWRPPNDKYQHSSYEEAFDPLDKGARQYLHRSIDTKAWRALVALFSSNYFRRFWIIQELSLSQSAFVFCGEHHIAWPLVGICASWLLSKGWDFQVGSPLTQAYNAFLIYVLPLASRSAITHFSYLDLSVMLGTTVGIFDATDPRDRIYALLGMPFLGNDPKQGTLLKPDYTASIQSVYTNAAKRMLQQDRHLRLLSSVQHGLELDPSWPSWVPKWNEPYQAEPLALREEQGYYANAGELFVPDKDSFSPDGKTLYLNGVQCTTVTEVGEPISKNMDLPRQILQKKNTEAMKAILQYLSEEENQLRSSWSSKMEQFPIISYSDPATQAKFITDEGYSTAQATAYPGKYGMRSSVECLTGDKAQGDHLGEFLIYWRERSSWKSEEVLHATAESMRKTDDLPTFSKEIILCSFNTFRGRKVFHCSDGKFGLCPAATQPGDVVVILFGGIVPYILRPLEGGGWRFVGECIVSGLMQGEGVEAAGLLRPDTFERATDGSLRLNVKKQEELDPRFERKAGEHGVLRFEIR